MGPLLGVRDQYYVIEVLGHEVQDLDLFMLMYEQNRVFQEWLTQQMQNVEYSEDWQDKVPTEP